MQHEGSLSGFVNESKHENSNLSAHAGNTSQSPAWSSLTGEFWSLPMTPRSPDDEHRCCKNTKLLCWCNNNNKPWQDHHPFLTKTAGASARWAATMVVATATVAATWQWCPWWMIPVLQVSARAVIVVPWLQCLQIPIAMRCFKKGSQEALSLPTVKNEVPLPPRDEQLLWHWRVTQACDLTLGMDDWIAHDSERLQQAGIL